MALRYSGKDRAGVGDAVRERIAGIRCWLLDMDGTVSLGEEMIYGAERFFAALGDRRFLFLTNNSSHSVAHYVARMNRIGIPTDRDEVLTSTDALLMELDRAYGRPVAAFPVGTPDFEEELSAGGVLLEHGMRGDIDMVLVGFDTTLTYAKLDAACDYIRAGAPWYAANPDRVCPLADGRVLPDCGAVIAFLEACTGTHPVKVIGKPDPSMIRMAMKKYGCAPGETALAGDRIYTDLAAARNAGITGVGVLTGESSFEEMMRGDAVPDFIFDNLGDVAEYL